MRYTLCLSTVVEGSDVFGLATHMEPLFGDIHVCNNILPIVPFANEEFVLGGEGHSAAFANETNEGHVAL